MPLAESIYDASVASYGGQVSTDEGSRLAAHLYAQSIEVAAARATLLAAGREVLPLGALAMLPERERELDIVPPAGDTVTERRGVVAARSRLPIEPTQANVENALRDVLAAAFTAYRQVAVTDAVAWPPDAGDRQLNLQLPTVPLKFVRVVVATMPGARTVSYQDVPLPLSPQPSAATDVLVGDVLLVEPENSARSEAVAVTAVGAGTFTATFSYAHDAWCLATTAPFPQWHSTKRTALVVATAAAAADPETRRKVHEIMARMARAVSTWSITPGGPFVLDQSLLDVHLFGAL